MSFGLKAFTPIHSQTLIEDIVAFDDAKIGARPISLTTVTTPAFRKTGFDYDNLYKISQSNGIIGFDYEANVNAQRLREGKEADFVAENNKRVKNWLSRSVGITNKDNTVLRFRLLHNFKTIFVVEKDGKLLRAEPDFLKPYLYEYTGNTQGVDAAIQYRMIGFDKIIAACFNGQSKLVIDLDPALTKVFKAFIDDFAF